MRHARFAKPIRRSRRLFSAGSRTRSANGSGNAGAVSTRVERAGRASGAIGMTLDAVAAALAVSRRTLIRRLAEEHASFRHILDEVRGDFARALLQDSSLSVVTSHSFCSIPNLRRSTGLCGETPQTPRAQGLTLPPLSRPVTPATRFVASP